MHKAVIFLTGTSLWLLTGCLQPLVTTTHYDNASNTQKLTFHTNEHDFLHSLKQKGNIKSRNAYMDEFLLKSDMQCSNYLNYPLNNTNQDNAHTDSLYMGIADTVSTLFGVRYITETAKSVFLNTNTQTSKKDKEAYANALSPEIRKGVEIGRARFSKEMLRKKVLPLNKYTLDNLKKDTLTYDKQCNLEYGLIEINRALKAMQTEMNRPSIVKKTKQAIDPKVIKKKVTQATQEVQKKELQDKSKKLNNHGILSI